MNTEQFCERLCNTYRLPRNKGNDYLHIHVNPSSTPFVLSQPTSTVDNYRGSKKGHRLDVSVDEGYFEATSESIFWVIRDWFPKLATHIEMLETYLYKVTYLRQGRGYQLNLATTYVFYDGYRIASDDNLEKLKVRTVPIIKVPTGYFDNTLGETLIEEFGDYLITLRTAKDAGFCDKGIEEFIETQKLSYHKPTTLRELAPFVVNYDIACWYHVRKLAKTAWRYAKICK